MSKNALRIFLSIVLTAIIPMAMAAEIDAKQTAIDAALTQTPPATETPAEEEAPVSIEAYRQKLSTEIVKEERAITHEFESYLRYIPNESLYAQPGKVSVIESAMEYNFSFKLFEELPVQLGIGSNYLGINASNDVPVSLPGKLTSFSFGAETTLPLWPFEKTYLRLGVIPTFYSSNWNFKANSLNMSSVAIVIYQPNEKLTLIAGVASNPGFENSLSPFGGLIYKPNDKWAFNLVPDRPTISYNVNDRIALFVEGGMSGSEYKVTKDGLKGVALAYNETHAGAGVKIKINKYIDASLSCGRLFNHYLKYRDSLGKVDIKNGIYSEFRIEARI